MDASAEAAALAEIHDDEQLEQQLKALHLKAQHVQHGQDEKAGPTDAAAHHPRPDEEALMPEELWNPHWQSNLKHLQVHAAVCPLGRLLA